MVERSGVRGLLVRRTLVRMTPKRRRRLRAALFGFVFGLVSILVVRGIGEIYRPTISIESAYWFFSAAFQVNGALAVAVFIVASLVLPKSGEDAHNQLVFFIVDLALVTSGVIASGIGILSVPSASQSFLFFLVALNFLTWANTVFMLFLGMTFSLPAKEK